MTRGFLFYIMKLQKRRGDILEKLEKMADFFAARADMYDEHMINDVEGCREGYALMADFVPENAEKLLDLGCGTGLELEKIFEKFPKLEVVGIDLCEEMLLRLKEKYSGKRLIIICGDYFSEEFGEGFDCAVSFQTMHHFKKEKKLELYRKICDALKPCGVYIECDYMVDTQQQEDLWFSENSRIRRELGIGEDEFYHYDTPCTVKNQLELFKKSGFTSAETVMRIENTTMIVARK